MGSSHIKPLKLRPSARDKRRYFLVKGGNEMNTHIESAILEYSGVLGLAQSAYMGVRVKEHKGFFVGSVLRETLSTVRASLAFKDIAIERVSGTLKGLKK